MTGSEDVKRARKAMNEPSEFDRNLGRAMNAFGVLAFIAVAFFFTILIKLLSLWL